MQLLRECEVLINVVKSFLLNWRMNFPCTYHNYVFIGNVFVKG